MHTNAGETLFKNILAPEHSLAKVKFMANKGVDKGCILCHPNNIQHSGW